VSELESQLSRVTSQLAERGAALAQYIAMAEDWGIEREQSSQKLEEVNRQLRQAKRQETQVLAEFEDVRACLESSRSEKEQAVKESLRLQTKLSEAEHHQRELEVARDECLSRISELEAQVLSASSELAEKEATCSQYLSKTTEWDKERNHLTSELEQLQLELVLMKTKETEINDELVEAHSRVKRAVACQEEAEEMTIGVHSQLQKIKMESQQAKKARDECLGRIAELEREQNELNLRLGEYERSCSTETAVIRGLRSDLASAEHKLQEANDRAKELESLIKKLKEEHEESLAKTTELSIQLAESQMKIYELNDKVSQATKQADLDRSSSVHSGIRFFKRFVDEGIGHGSSHNGGRRRSLDFTDSGHDSTFSQDSWLESIDEKSQKDAAAKMHRMEQRIAILEDENAAYAASLTAIKSELDDRGEETNEG